MDAPRIGVLVPCRNEEAVIERRLRNLALAVWPPATGPHRLVVVDDGSGDRTAERARALCATLFGDGVRAEVVRNAQRPGKPGAIAQALLELEGSVDLLVLTDADVVFEPAALERVAAAFAREPGPAMATGEQRFVAGLAEDGSCRGPGGAALADAGGVYDGWTARVRRLESRRGALFSVHGQLLAWRAALGLRPTPGIAADDLDLMLQARAGGGRVVQVRGARFLEVRAPAGAERRAQALRRARAYVQFLGHPRIAELCSTGSALRRWQATLYRRVPTAAPWWVAEFVLVSLLVAAGFGGVPSAGVLALLWIAVGISPAGRRAVALMRVIAGAVRSEAREDLGDRWETARR